MSLLSLILCALAFALFGLATDAHHHRHLDGPLARSRKAAMRRLAWGAIALAFVIDIAAAGWIFGPITWAGKVMLGPGLAFLALNFTPPRGSSPRRRP